MSFQISKIFRDDMFNSLIPGDEKKVWNTFRLVSTNSLGNIRSENYKELIDDMLSLYHKLGCTVSRKIHTLHFHFDFFLDNLVPDEHGEIFIMKFQRWRNDIRTNGPLPCWLSTVERSPEMLLSSYTSNRQSEVASSSGRLSLHVCCTYFLNM